MKHCSEIDPLLTAYIDGETDAQTSSEVAAHLAVCGSCRDVADAERMGKAAIGACRTDLCESAPEYLRVRCATARPRASEVRFRPRRWVAVAAAASLVVVAGGVIVSLLTARLDAAVVAQLMLDHLKCFTVARDKQESIDAHAAAESLSTRYGWNVVVPPSDSSRDLTLIEARRCLYLDGAIAHILYRRNGRALSLFFLPNTTRQERQLEVMGHEAVLWADGGHTYAMVGHEGQPAMQELAVYFRSASGE